MKSDFVKMLIICCVVLPLLACGVKPNDVDPPSDLKNDTFPNRYPSSK